MTRRQMPRADALTHRRAGHDSRPGQQTRKHGKKGWRSQRPSVARLAGRVGSGGLVKVHPSRGWVFSPAVSVAEPHQRRQ